MINISRALFPVLIILNASCKGQAPQNNSTTNTESKPMQMVGGPCEGCEVVFEGMPETFSSVDTNEAWTGPSQKIKVSGKVLKKDGQTAAPNVIVYYYHTDHTGRYPRKPGKTGPLHGYLRGWVKTDADGNYTIYTGRPASYPNSTIPAHIHILVKEPGIDNAYYMNDIVFDDDPLLTAAERKKTSNRGGPGILKFTPLGDMHVAIHNITLGLNIPDYSY
jgi:protocatechuate 3,4-dioxygenase beta subunit